MKIMSIYNITKNIFYIRFVRFLHMKKSSVSKIKQKIGTSDATIKLSEYLNELGKKDLDTEVGRQEFFMTTVHHLEAHLRKIIAMEIKENTKFYKKIWRILVIPATNQFPPDSSELEDQVLSYCSFNNDKTLLRQLENFSIIDDFFMWKYGNKNDYDNICEIYEKFNIIKHKGLIPPSSERLREIQENIDCFFDKLMRIYYESLVHGRIIDKYDSQTADAKSQEIIKIQKMRVDELPWLIDKTVKSNHSISKKLFMDHSNNLKLLFGAHTR